MKNKKLILKLTAVSIALLTATTAFAVSYREIKARIYDNSSVTIKGNVASMTDVYGNEVKPIVYNGITYVPAIMMETVSGEKVVCDGNGNVVVGKEETPTPKPPVTNYIGEDAAKAKALSHAGLKEQDTDNIKVYSKLYKTPPKYEVKIYKKNTKYSYDIDAVTGAVISYEKETIVTPSPLPPSEVTLIESATAQNIALKHAGCSESEVYRLKTKLKGKRDYQYYEVEWKKGGLEYEYKVSATTGEILKAEVEDND